MGDPAALALQPPPSSPSNTISSIYSSDLDTESTGSFFHDRSTTLGSLMGVSFPAITCIRRVPSHRSQQQQQQRDTHVTTPGSGTMSKKKKKKKKRASPIIPAAPAAARRRRWWQLCGDDAKPASLGDFLEVERRFGDTMTFYDHSAEEVPSTRGRLLFADGRVMPPAASDDESDSSSSTAEFLLCTGGLCRQL